MAELKQIFEAIDSYRQEIIELETKLTAIPALSPKSGGAGEQEKAEFLKTYLHELGITEVEELRAPDPEVPCGYRPNLIATLPGKDTSKSVWLMAHMDVVPPGDEGKWNSDPWQVKVDGDKIYGRGVEDNQQGLCASIMAVKAFMQNKLIPPVNIKLLFVADEETGNELGIGHVMQNAPFSKDDFIIVPDGGLPDGSQIEVAEKGILWLKVTVRGSQCHASMPDKGNNAMVAASQMVVALEGLHDEFSKQDEVFDPPCSTFQPTKREANVPNVNTIPGEDIFYVDCRVLPDYELDAVFSKAKHIVQEIAEQRAVEVELEAVQKAHAAPPTPVDAPVVLALKQAVRDVYQVEGIPMGIGGGTVAAHIREGGFNAVVWSKQDETMHSPNEYALLSNIIGDAKVFAHVVYHAK